MNTSRLFASSGRMSAAGWVASQSSHPLHPHPVVMTPVRNKCCMGMRCMLLVSFWPRFPMVSNTVAALVTDPDTPGGTPQHKSAVEAQLEAKVAAGAPWRPGCGPSRMGTVS